MKAKNNISNKRKKVNRKKVLKFRRLATVLALLIATIVVIAFGSWKVMSYGGKVLGTQVQMALSYSKIQSAQRAHDYYISEALSYGSGPAAIYYFSLAEEEDEKIDHWNDVRSQLYHSDDSVVAEAAKDGFEFSTFFIGLASFLAPIALLALIIRFREKAFDLFRIEVLLFDSIMSGFFFVVRFILVRLVRFCSFEFNFNNYNRKRDLADLKHDKHMRKKKSNVVPMPRKKRKIG